MLILLRVRIQLHMRMVPLQVVLVDELNLIGLFLSLVDQFCDWIVIATLRMERSIPNSIGKTRYEDAAKTPIGTFVRASSAAVMSTLSFLPMCALVAECVQHTSVSALRSGLGTLNSHLLLKAYSPLLCGPSAQQT
jgi:hypothetical protein